MSLIRTGQQCSVDNLPVFEELRDHISRNGIRPERDRFQAIVPAYTFQCSGRVTEWTACVEPGGSANEQYYIQFQVWRPTGNTDGCYTLVGYNIPLHDANAAVNGTMTEEESMEGSSSETARQSIIETEGFLSPPGDSSDPLNHCVELSVRDSEQLEVQAGDVVGYYVDRPGPGSDGPGPRSDGPGPGSDGPGPGSEGPGPGSEGPGPGSDGPGPGSDRTDGGIQWMQNSSDVVVYYRYNLPREDIWPAYTIGGQDANACGFDISGNSHLYTLSISASAAPIISLNIGKAFFIISIPVNIFLVFSHLYAAADINISTQ